MKRFCRIMASVLAASLMVVFLACNVFAASVDISGQWYGNTSTAGTTISQPFAVLENKKICVNSDLELAIASGTTEETINMKVILCRSTWYGSANVLTQTYYNNVAMSNTTDAIDYERRSFGSCATAPATGEYYVVCQVKGATNAFLFKLGGNVTYAVD